MKNRQFLILFLLILVAAWQSCNPDNQKLEISARDYEQAERFLPENITQYVYNLRVDPHWINDTSLFWYEQKTRKGRQFFLVNPAKKMRKPLFDQSRLALSLSKVLNKEIQPYQLPFRRLALNKELNRVTVTIDKKQWVIDLNNYTVKPGKPVGNSVNDRFQSISPNGQWVAYRKKYNLYVKNRRTNRVVQLTHDGEKDFFYGATLPWAWMQQIGPVEKKAPRIELDVVWSPDSKMIFAYKLDLRKARKLYLLQNVPDSGLRSKVFSYYRALAGDKDVALLVPYVFNLSTGRKIRLKIPPYNNITNYDNWQWIGKDNRHLYFVYRPRGYKSVSLYVANTKTGDVRKIFQETSNTYVDPLNFQYQFLPESHELLWLSERDGWNHIYLYDLETGKVIRKITEGHYVVRRIEYVDTAKHKIYFTAGGHEPGEDPYFNNLYVINFDGTGVKLLTPENATHEISISPDKKYFIDNYSRVDKKPVSELRSLDDGSVVMNFGPADIKDLLATGWKYPQPFKLKARDDSTEIYGVLFKPINFDPHKKYPVIDAIYAGPQAVRTPKSFYAGFRNEDQPLADLGFIVFTVDGLGTAQRSKKFHDYSYMNLGDIGLPDHMKAIRYLAGKYPWIDTTRVGIYGHSAGGYDAARAIMLKPNFFKAAFAASGDYNLRVAKAWWPELYMGYPAGPDYAQQNDVHLVSRLKGKLMLVHGDMDTNVHPAELYRMANALEKDQKDFQMMVIPNYSHGITHNPFYVKLKWNFFVKNLLGATPPANFKVTYMNTGY